MITSSQRSALSLLLLPLATLLAAACGDAAFTGNSADGGNAGSSGNGAGGKTTSGGASSSAAASHGGANSSAGASHGGASSGGASHGGAGTSHGGASNAGSAGSAHAGSATNPEGGAGGSTGGEGGDSAGFGGAAEYDGPSVGKAQTFAALAYSAITTANISEIGGELGVSAGAMSTITGFAALAYKKYGLDSLAPNSQRTILAQQDVTALVGNIDPRACDVDLTNVVGGLTGDITLYPGVTCMNSFSADVLLNGHVYLDAGGDPNAFFIIKGNLTLTVADAAQVVLQNGAQACGVFWRISKEVTIGKTVKFFGTVISGTAITMKTGSTLNGRALAQTAGVQLDANSVKIPAACTHVQ
jgi:Ice-binding-like